MNENNIGDAQIISETVVVDEVAYKALKFKAIKSTCIWLLLALPMGFQLMMAGMIGDSCHNGTLGSRILDVSYPVAVIGFPVFLITSIIGMWVAVIGFRSKKIYSCFVYLPLLSWAIIILSALSLQFLGC